MSTILAPAPPRYSSAYVKQYQVSDACERCGTKGLLYHDFDPYHYHNGITCLACGHEQTLSTGVKSLIDFNARRKTPGRRNRTTKWDRYVD